MWPQKLEESKAKLRKLADEAANASVDQPDENNNGQGTNHKAF